MVDVVSGTVRPDPEAARVPPLSAFTVESASSLIAQLWRKHQRTRVEGDDEGETALARTDLASLGARQQVRA